MITVYFGSPGSGKTTMAVRALLKAKKFYRYTFSNFETSQARQVSLKDIGIWTLPPRSYLAIDEAGIEYNNRKFKSLNQKTIEWFKLHRHYQVDISVWSQSWDDMDITIRRLADRLFYIRKIGPFTMIRRIYKRVTVDKQTEQIIDGYRMSSMIWFLLKPLYYLTYPIWFFLPSLIPWQDIKLVWRRPYYKYFDTLSKPDTPVRYDDDNTLPK